MDNNSKFIQEKNHGKILLLIWFGELEMLRSSLDSSESERLTWFRYVQRRAGGYTGKRMLVAWM